MKSFFREGRYCFDTGLYERGHIIDNFLESIFAASQLCFRKRSRASRDAILDTDVDSPLYVSSLEEIAVVRIFFFLARFWYFSYLDVQSVDDHDVRVWPGKSR